MHKLGETLYYSIKANASKEQIISFGYTEAEYKKAENALYENAQTYMLGSVFWNWN